MTNEEITRELLALANRITANGRETRVTMRSDRSMTLEVEGYSPASKYLEAFRDQG